MAHYPYRVDGGRVPHELAVERLRAGAREAHEVRAERLGAVREPVLGAVTPLGRDDERRAHRGRAVDEAEDLLFALREAEVAPHDELPRLAESARGLPFFAVRGAFPCGSPGDGGRARPLTLSEEGRVVRIDVRDVALERGDERICRVVVRRGRSLAGRSRRIRNVGSPETEDSLLEDDLLREEAISCVATLACFLRKTGQSARHRPIDFDRPPRDVPVLVVPYRAPIVAEVLDRHLVDDGHRVAVGRVRAVRDVELAVGGRGLDVARAEAPRRLRRARPQRVRRAPRGRAVVHVRKPAAVGSPRDIDLREVRDATVLLGDLHEAVVRQERVHSRVAEGGEVVTPLHAFGVLVDCTRIRRLIDCVVVGGEAEAVEGPAPEAPAAFAARAEARRGRDVRFVAGLVREGGLWLGGLFARGGGLAAAARDEQPRGAGERRELEA